jgi:hypothetical protein
LLLSSFFFEFAEDGGFFSGVAGGDAFAESCETDELGVELVACRAVGVAHVFFETFGEGDGLHALVNGEQGGKLVTLWRERGELGCEVVTERGEGDGYGFGHVGRRDRGTKGQRDRGEERGVAAGFLVSFRGSRGRRSLLMLSP